MQVILSLHFLKPVVKQADTSLDIEVGLAVAPRRHQVMRVQVTAQAFMKHLGVALHAH